jgi:hypothetical protein
VSKERSRVLAKLQSKGGGPSLRAPPYIYIYIYARGTNSKSHPKCFDGVDGSPKRLKLSIISFSYRSAPSRRPSVIVVVVVRPSVRPPTPTSEDCALKCPRMISPTSEISNPLRPRFARALLRELHPQVFGAESDPWPTQARTRDSKCSPQPEGSTLNSTQVFGTAT